MKKKVFLASSALVLGFGLSGCVGALYSASAAASSIGSIVNTGSSLANMIQSVDVSGAVNSSYKDYIKSINSVAIEDFSSSASWWGGSNGKNFTNNIETQLMSLGLNTYKKSSGMAQAYVTGSVSSSANYSYSMGASGQMKSKISEVSFSLVDKGSGRTMASVNLAYKKGVSAVEAAKGVARALKAIIKYPNLSVEEAFKKVK